MKQVDPRKILLLCYNRNAAISLRRRLKSLLGKDGASIMVQTFHGLALSLTGYQIERKDNDEIDFDNLLWKAIALLKGDETQHGLEVEEQREYLLGGLEYLLVDEYQDIDEPQYQLIAALAGKNESEDDARLNLMAVGDDDQSIYGFRDASVRFIRLFESDYSARTHFLTWNYRSTANIIACSNYLISHNQGRMKCEHPIVIDRARQMLPPGGEWSALEPSEGKVVIQHCTGAAQQAAEVVRQIQYIQRLQPECPLEKIAVIARNGLDKKELIWVRSALADAGIPCRFALEKDYGFPIRHCREIANYLLWLRERALESLTPAELCQQLPGRDQANRWHDIIYELIEQWELSQGGEPLPAAYFEHFILEYLHAQHSQVRFGLGVLLSTVHGVKGEEFEHVIILDGGWRSSHSLQPENNEEERRLFYVGMTRAISRLVIMHDDRAPNPYIEQLDPAVISHTAAQAVAPGILRRFSIIGLRQLYISFAGGHPAGHPIHSLLTDTQVGDSVQLVSVGNTIKVNANQSAIAQLSSAGKSQWQFSLSGIRKIEVLAMLQRSKTLTAEDYQVAVKVDNWYVPILLVETREEAAYDNIT